MLVISAREVYHLYSETAVLVQQKQLNKVKAQKKHSVLKPDLTAPQDI